MVKLAATEGARAIDGAKMNFLGQRRKESEHTADVFGTDGGKKEDRSRGREFRLPSLSKDFGGVWIVRAIENDGGFTGAAEGFEATRPIGVAETVLHSIVAQVEAESMEGGQSDGGIPGLVSAFEGKRISAKWFIDDGQGCAFFVSLHGDDALGISELRGGNHGLFGADDAGFFTRDGADGVAEPLGVVEANRRDHADIGGHGRGGIEPTAHAGFENDQLTFALGEIFHRKGESDLEKGRMRFERSAKLVQCIEMAQAFILRDVFA